MGVEILLVEDEDDSRALVEHMLGGSGATVRSAKTGLEALELFRVRPPHVLIAGIGLPASTATI